MHANELARAIAALNLGHWDQAAALAANVLAQFPDDADAHFITGVSLMEQQQAQKALAHLQQAAALDPSRTDYALYLARAYASLQRLLPALDEAKRALTLAHPDDAYSLDTAGVVFSQCHAHELAARAFQQAVEAMPGNAAFRFNLGTSLTFFGDLVGAERELEACLRLAPHHWNAHHSLSQLRRQTADANHIDRLLALLPAASGKITATTYVNMALAKEYEDLGEHEKSFQHCVLGKSAPKQMIQYSRTHQEALFDALPASFVANSGHESPPGFDSREPIFIIGMPRTGTTLVDRILSSHPLVQSAGELQHFSSAWKRALGGSSFSMLSPTDILAAREIDWHALGKEYVESTRPLTGERPFFTDKLPHNFLYTGFIAQALPNAKFICVRRNPMDTCLSNFRQLFAPESPYFDYSYGLIDTGHYYVLFDRLMARWNQLFPGRILSIDYEDIVLAQEQSTRKLLAHCGLDWDEACLRFEKNAAPTTTASAAQVRAPIYRSALNRWKRYEEQLRPLKAFLEEAGIPCEDVQAP